LKKLADVPLMKSKNARLSDNLLSVMLFHMNKNSKKIKGKDNRITISEARLRKVTFDIIGDENTISVKQGTEISDTLIRIRGSNHTLEIGEKCRIKGTLWFEDEGCRIMIGDRTTFQGVGIAVSEQSSLVRIGTDCLFSYGIDIRSGDSHSIIDLQTNERINYAQDVDIGDHVWIGADVRILKGVKIGSNSIVGSNAVVTKSIPEHSMAAGIPARVIKSNVTWSRRRIFRG